MGLERTSVGLMVGNLSQHGERRVENVKLELLFPVELRSSFIIDCITIGSRKCGRSVGKRHTDTATLF